MVDQQDGNVMPVRKLFEKSDVLIIICVQIAVTAGRSDALQGVDHNELGRRMLGQKLLNLLLQAVFKRVGQDRKVQRRRCIFRQIKEPRLDTPVGIFETEIQNFTLRYGEIPERLALRNAQAEP